MQIVLEDRGCLCRPARGMFGRPAEPKPDHCQVTPILRPTPPIHSDREILKFLQLLPTTNYNSTFHSSTSKKWQTTIENGKFLYFFNFIPIINNNLTFLSKAKKVKTKSIVHKKSDMGREGEGRGQSRSPILFF